MKTNNENKNHHQHTPVLLDQVVDLLTPQAGESYLDLTAGYGGHASKIIKLTDAPKKAVLVDRDQTAIDSLKDQFSDDVTLMHQDFASAAKDLQKSGRQFDMILMDLGVSSVQLDEPERGFSFSKPAKLDMRMDIRQSQSARELVNELSADELQQIIRKYGEEPHAKRIAQAIVKARPIETTADLARIVTTCVRGYHKTHPATRTFQALRLAVNQELEQLTDTLKVLIDLLAPNGRVAIISFHSLEDRLVKQWLKQEVEAGYEARLKVLTKKPIHGQTEDVKNARARSAKLRGAVKINT